MNRRPFTRKEKAELKKVKTMHKKEKQLDPEGFTTRRVDLANSLATAIMGTKAPRWGALTFKFDKTRVVWN